MIVYLLVWLYDTVHGNCKSGLGIQTVFDPADWLRIGIISISHLFFHRDYLLLQRRTQLELPGRCRKNGTCIVCEGRIDGALDIGQKVQAIWLQGLTWSP